MGTVTEPKKARFSTSPSRISRFFFQECERFFRFHATPREARTVEGVPKPPFEHSPVTAAILETGFTWEETVVKKHLGGRVDIARSKEREPVRDRIHGIVETRKLLETLPVGRFIYQATLLPPPAFYERFGLDPALIEFGPNRPDLIEILDGENGRRRFRVIDVKASDALKITHRIQVALYALELDSIVRDLGIDADVDLDTGGIWLADRSASEDFELTLIRPHVEQFLRVDMPRILSAPASEAAWHLFFRCEYCEYFDHCRDEAIKTQSVSLIPYLSQNGKRFLAAEASSHTLPQLKTFLAQNDADAVLGRSASLAARGPSLRAEVDALLEADVRPYEGSSLAMPVGENIGVVITVQEEPVRGQAYLFGLRVRAKKEVLADVLKCDAKAEVFIAKSESDVAANRGRFLARLHQLFSRVHAYNAKHAEWKEQLSLQAYVFDSFEATSLERALLGALADGDSPEQALALLFHFQSPELITTDKHPAKESPFPIVVLTSVLRRLFALPVPIAYRLPEVLRALAPEGTFRYEARDYYHFPLSNALKSDAIFAAWGGDKKKVDGLTSEVASRLYATAHVIEAIRARAGKRLFAWPPKFQLVEDWKMTEPLLSRLAFMTRYESVVQCLATRDARTASPEERQLRGTGIAGRAITATRLRIEKGSGDDLEQSDFHEHLLSRDHDDGERQMMSFNDYLWRNRAWAPDLEHAAIVGIDSVARDGATGAARELTMRWVKTKTGLAALVVGDRYHLNSRYTDWTSERVIKRLRELDGEYDAWFVRLLKSPERAAGVVELPAAIAKREAWWAGRMSLTPSQRAAFDVARTRKLSLVWGPPGTGKTRFLVAAIAAMVESHARAGRPFRVLVSAFTHAAIEHLLRGLVAELTKLEATATVAKIGGWQRGDVPSGIQQWDPKRLAHLDVEGCVVVGATVYKLIKDTPEFDLVVIDEASQMRLAEGALPLSARAAEGRAIVAGDDRQLPPIVHAQYPDGEPGERPLHRSLFEALRPAADDGAPALAQLLENWRMNRRLTDFAARNLYGERYQCANDAVADRRLAWTAPRRDRDEAVAFCLDPAYPLVLAVLEGVFAARENQVEAELVARLVVGLRRGLRDERDMTYSDTSAGDHAFFREGVFVVSPHHAQIRAIRRALDTARTWKSAPFVDTVDKMQGQEAWAVVVSYGVSDPEFAEQEAEFIYSLNRLNVAITRAKTKCVVCLPRPLLEGTPQVLDSEEATRGLGFMRALERYCVENGERAEFQIADGTGRLVVWRAGASV